MKQTKPTFVGKSTTIPQKGTQPTIKVIGKTPPYSWSDVTISKIQNVSQLTTSTFKVETLDSVYVIIVTDGMEVYLSLSSKIPVCRTSPTIEVYSRFIGNTWQIVKISPIQSVEKFSDKVFLVKTQNSIYMLGVV